MPRNCAPQHDLCNSTCLQGTRCLQVSFAMQHMQCCGESAVSSFPTVFFAYSHFRFSFTSFALRSLLWLLGMSVSPLPPLCLFFFSRFFFCSFYLAILSHITCITCFSFFFFFVVVVAVVVAAAALVGYLAKLLWRLLFFFFFDPPCSILLLSFLFLSL